MNSEQIYLLIAECAAVGEDGTVTVPVATLLGLINNALDVDTIRHHPARNTLLVTLLHERTNLCVAREEFPGEIATKRDAYDHAMRLIEGEPDIVVVKPRKAPRLRVIGGGRG